MSDSEETKVEPTNKVSVPAEEVLAVSFFQLDGTNCKCGAEAEVVRLAVTSKSQSFVTLQCLDCAAEDARQLSGQVADFHAPGDGHALVNSRFIPETAGGSAVPQ